MTRTAEPKPPNGLQAAGRALWRAVLSGYELSESEQALLELACGARDDAAAARAAIIRDGAVIDGRYGPRAHPGIPIARQAEAIVSRILGQLGTIDRDAAAYRDPHAPGPKPRGRNSR